MRKKVTSTYRREYSPERSATQPAVIRNFGANFNYRGYRRQVEHGHHRSPFVWDDWEYELLDQPIVPSGGYRRKLTKKVQVDGFSSDSEYSDSTDSSTARSSDVRTRAAEGKSRQVKVRGRRERRSPHMDECNCGAEQGKAVKSQGRPVRFLSDTISKSLKRVPKRCDQVLPDRPSSAPVDEESPFVQYGAGDSEEETGNKRTHNVLSRQGVYPSAVDAKHRHIIAKELRSQQPIREVRSKTTLHDPEFNNKMNKQTSRWQSEYSKCYRKYPTCRYQ